VCSFELGRCERSHDDCDAPVVGGTFWVNTKAVTIAGIAPEGFFGDRNVEHAAGFLSADRGAD